MAAADTHRPLLPKRGTFITFEGPEGAGKTTQVEHLRRRLEAASVTVSTTREPGGTVIGLELRAMLLLPNRPPLSPRAEALLLNTDRAQHVEEAIRPALASGMVVISDRYADSTLAHQGYGAGLELLALEKLIEFATGGLMPDLTVLLDIDVEAGLDRRHAAFRSGEGEYNRIDRRELAYHQRVREGYLQLAKRYDSRYFVVDASQPEEVVTELTWRRVGQLLRLTASVHD